MKATNLEPVFPINGDVLHNRDGFVSEEGLTFTAKIKAPAGSRITVNGLPAQAGEGIFEATLRVNQYENNLVWENLETGESLALKIYYAKNFAGKYRLSIDDNIRFMQDIAAHALDYQSIFDNPYLHQLRSLHQRYGTKVHLNLFYESEQGDFNLSAFPEKFKAEWASQRDWLRLSFHAYAEFPDAPYQHAPFDVVKKDCDLVQAEIRRIAGDALMGPVTTVHWGEVNIEGSRALRAGGYKGQLGYFNVDDELPPVSYYLSVEQRRHMKKRFIWKDVQEDIIFIRSSVVLDKKEQAEIVPFLNSYQQTSGLPPYVDFLIHEQYFYPDYSAYQPDYFARIETAVQWALDNGYTPAFLDECIFN
jgi:hypothetical protein